MDASRRVCAAGTRKSVVRKNAGLFHYKSYRSFRANVLINFRSCDTHAIACAKWVRFDAALPFPPWRTTTSAPL